MIFKNRTGLIASFWDEIQSGQYENAMMLLCILEKYDEVDIEESA